MKSIFYLLIIILLSLFVQAQDEFSSLASVRVIWPDDTQVIDIEPTCIPTGSGNPDLKPLAYIDYTDATTNSIVIIAIGTDTLKNPGIQLVKIYRREDLMGYGECYGMRICTLIKPIFERDRDNHYYYAKVYDNACHETISEVIGVSKAKAAVKITGKQGESKVFTLDEETAHTLTFLEVEPINNQILEEKPISAKIKLESYFLTLIVGEYKSVDLDNNGINDIEVTLTSIDAGGLVKAEIIELPTNIIEPIIQEEPIIEPTEPLPTIIANIIKTIKERDTGKERDTSHIKAPPEDLIFKQETKQTIEPINIIKRIKEKNPTIFGILTICLISIILISFIIFKKLKNETKKT